MQFPFFSRVRRRAMIASISALLLLVALSPACQNASSPGEGSESKTPIGKTVPRTSLPMPPTTPAGGSPAIAQTFTLLDDRRLTLSDYLGKVVVLDFWATYCLPCREAAPHLDALQNRFGEQDLIVIGLNVGGPDDHPKIPEFVKSLGISYSLGIPEPEMINLFVGSDDKIPQTLIFDREGHVVKHFVGYDSTVAVELDRTIEDALATKK